MFLNPLKDSIGLLVLLVGFAIPIALFWVIVRRTGKRGAWSLLLLIPYLGVLILLLMLAFGKWPVLERRPEVEPTNR